MALPGLITDFANGLLTGAVYFDRLRCQLRVWG